MKKGETKEYTLSNDEMGQIQGRMRSVEYFKSLVEEDIQAYIDNIVKPRLGIKVSETLLVDLNTGKAKLSTIKNEHTN